MNNILPFRTFDRNDFQPVDYVLDTTDSESECVEDMFGRCLSARAADASHSSLLRVSTVGGIAIAVITALYFGGQLLRGVL